MTKWRVRIALALAVLSGFLPYSWKDNPEQIVWARSRKDADEMKWGQDVFDLLPKILRKMLGR